MIPNDQQHRSDPANEKNQFLEKKDRKI